MSFDLHDDGTATIETSSTGGEELGARPEIGDSCRDAAHIVSNCPACQNRDLVLDRDHAGNSTISCLTCHTEWRYSLGFLWSTSVGPPRRDVEAMPLGDV